MDTAITFSPGLTEARNPEDETRRDETTMEVY
jgi:hypothetical protein